MTTDRARRVLLDRLAGGDVALLSLHLELPAVPSWADGTDATGRAVALVGAHALGQTDVARAALDGVLAALAEGTVPEGVLTIIYAPKASEAFARIVAEEAVPEDDILEALVHGPRQSGKTMLAPGVLAWLAEQRARAGLPLPLKAMWLHDTLKNASEKTAASLEESLWGGLWGIRDDRQRAILTVGGVEYVHGSFVGTADSSAAERLRAAAHALVTEEAIASLEEGGVDLRRYLVALSSLHRLATPRKVSIVLTNPGGTDSWPFGRFLGSERAPRTIACEVPADDRLSTAQIRAQHDTFRGSLDLQARLARGEWADLILGPQVAKGFDPLVHTAKAPIPVIKGLDFWCGWIRARRTAMR